MIDLILLAIFLFAGIYGFRQGLMRSLIGLLGNILALVLGYAFSKPVAAALQAEFFIIDNLAERVKGFLPMPEDFSVMAASMEGLGKLYSYLENAPLPQSVKESILNNVQTQLNEVSAGMFVTMADMVAQTAAQFLLQGLVFIGLWLLFFLVLSVFGKIFAGFIHHIPVIGLLDRLGGMFVTLFLVLLTVTVLYSGIDILGLNENGLLAQSQILPMLSGIFQS